MSPASTPPTPCSNCQAPMQNLALEGHYKRLVSVDSCAACRLVWFDEFESVRLSGLGWVQLLRHMITCENNGSALGTLQAQLRCLRCKAELKAVRNLTRFGRFAALECPARHGQYQSFSLLLAERGLVRPIASQDRQTLRAQQRPLECLNCGAPQPNEAGSPAQQLCSHCASPLMMIDLPRLTQALLVRHGDVLQIDEPARQLALACNGCGGALDPTQDTRCPHCDHPVSLPSLRSVAALLQRVEPLLLNQMPRQARPWGEKLSLMKGDYRHTHLYRLIRHWFEP